MIVENAAAASTRVELIVLTAPGAGALPWDESKCTHPKGTPHSGKNGCRCAPGPLAKWNATRSARWSALHRATATRLRRRFGPWRYVCQAWEPQERGAMHNNIVVRAGTPRERAQAAFYRRTLAELAPRYGFGFVDRKTDVKEALHAARYIAKYLSEGTGKLGIGDLAARGDAPAVIARVSRELTQQTGSTIRACRRRRANWNLASHLAPMSPDGCSIGEADAVRCKIERARLMATMQSRGRRRRLGHELGLNELLERQGVEREADLRWSHFLLAKAGLEPEPLD